MLIYLIILFALAVVYVILPKKHRLWIVLGACILIYHFLKHKLKLPDFFTNFFGSKSSKYLDEIKKIRKEYISEKDIKDIPRSKSIAYIESILKDADK